MLFSRSLLLLLVVLAILVLPSVESKSRNGNKKKGKPGQANHTRYKALFEQAKMSIECVGMQAEELHS